MVERPSGNGFTLVEVVVALGIFSIAILALLHAAGEQARAFSLVERTTVARFVADNQIAMALADTRIKGRGSATGEERQADRVWAWTRTVAATQDPFILRIDVAVNERDDPQVLAEATAFISTREGL